MDAIKRVQRRASKLVPGIKKILSTRIGLNYQNYQHYSSGGTGLISQKLTTSLQENTSSAWIAAADHAPIS